MSTQEVITIIAAVTGCDIALMAAWQATQNLRDGRSPGPRPATRGELDRGARKWGLA